MAMEKEYEEESGNEEEASEDAAISMDDDTAADAVAADATATVDETPKKNKSKKNEKSKRLSKRENEDEEQRAARKAARKTAKTELKSQIPALDPETGIAYSKIQIRRMMRRVKHGLAPIATQEEETEIRQREKMERREEEALYAEEEQRQPDEVKDDGDGDGEENNNDGHPEGEYQAGDVVSDDEQETKVKPPRKNHNPPPLKKAKRSKLVPPDYVCSACKNLCDNFSPHWIYDCPMKKTKKGCNQVAKRLRGLHDPPSQKVFVGGLPFDCDEGSVRRFFEESLKNNGDSSIVAELVHCKLLTFADSKRCKGQGFLTFDCDEGAKLALRMNGKIWKDVEEPGMKDKKKTKDGAEGTTKQLKLVVTKMKNRFVTKQAHKRG